MDDASRAAFIEAIHTQLKDDSELTEEFFERMAADPDLDAVMWDAVNTSPSGELKDVLNPGERADVLHRVAGIPWGDTSGALEDIGECLERVLAATRAEFLLWEDRGEEIGLDEFSLERRHVETMSPEWKLAYVARLVQSLAMAYGGAGLFSADDVSLELDPGSPGGLLHALDGIFAARSAD